jgi:DNA repair exonuclease SbcCD ATPase subunit
MDIRIISLTLDHFKGAEHFTFTPNGENIVVFGKNATGKTTLYDALTWCLWGKDSQGRKDFDIKPLDENNQVKDHSAITSVTALLETTEGFFTFQRTYYEKWSKKRGKGDATFDGHSSDYFVNEIPVRKSEFDDKVAALVEEDTFRLLTSVTYLPETMKWQERREMLFRLAGTASETEIMERDPRFAPLAEALDGRGLDDYKKVLLSHRKGLDKDRKDIPARIDECKRTLANCSGVDFDALREQRETLAQQEEQVKAELALYSAGSATTQLRSQLTQLEAQIRSLDAEDRAYQAEHRQAGEDPDELEALLRRMEIQERGCRSDLESTRNQIKAQEEELESLRGDWKRIGGEVYSKSDRCHSCGQKLPSAQLDQARSKWATDRDRRLNAVTKSASEIKAHIEELKSRQTEQASALRQMEEKVDKVQARLDKARQAAQTPPEHMPEYVAKRDILETKSKELRAQVSQLEADSTTGYRKLAEKRLHLEIATLDVELAKEGRIRDANKRIEELNQQARKAAAAVEELDQMLYLCEEFSRFRASFVEQSVNQLFENASFRLFREQINGGLEECCDVMFQGVPYGSLNNGARINIGIDIIRTFSREMGIHVPLFVDNAESVTDLWNSGGQMVLLVVNKDDEVLRTERMYEK